MIKIVNLTPHTVNILDKNGSLIVAFPPEATPARLKATIEKTGEIVLETGEVIPLTSSFFGEPEGLPEQQEDTFFIVSALFKQALPERKDLLIPNEAVRDEAGRIIGCKSLA